MVIAAETAPISDRQYIRGRPQISCHSSLTQDKPRQNSAPIFKVTG
jgi:hypothetical protein